MLKHFEAEFTGSSINDVTSVSSVPLCPLCLCGEKFKNSGQFWIHLFGSLTVNTEPRPGRLCTVIVPP
jgi:hypothetical protein